MTRQSPFSYTCRQCNRCCYEKRIPLNPYEIIRLAQVVGVSTGVFLERFTEEGTALAVRERPGQPCVFLGEKGCTVHAGRPAACRLYPLGRMVRSTGEERFCEVQPHPESEGDYGLSGTVGEYLEAQEVESFFRAAELYYQVFQRVQSLLATAHADDEPGEVAWDVLTLLDADQCIADRGWVVPNDPEEKMLLHIASLNRWLDTLVEVK
nr:YkgJ family cysteine cluster protein [Armatimonas rosea]